MTKRKIFYLGTNIKPRYRQKALAHYAPSHYVSTKEYGIMLSKRKRIKKTSC